MKPQINRSRRASDDPLHLDLPKLLHSQIPLKKLLCKKAALFVAGDIRNQILNPFPFLPTNAFFVELLLDWSHGRRVPLKTRTVKHPTLNISPFWCKRGEA